MNGYLVDTNVLSEYNRTGAPNAGVKEWLETTARERQHVSVITLAEIQKGIELLAGGKRRAQLEQWLQRDLETWFSGRGLDMNFTAIFLRWLYKARGYNEITALMNRLRRVRAGRTFTRDEMNAR